MISIFEIAKSVEGTFIQKCEDTVISHLFTDSRKHFNESESLFFAIKTESNDGHKYLNDLYERGCRNFIVETDIKPKYFPNATIIRVKNAVEALQKLGELKRKNFTGKVIGITGSNGKTIVKEWLYQLLAPHKYTIKSPGSYNSQVGVPLSLWNMNEKHELGIIEAGISQPGEMERLQKIIQPHIGIFTNIGTSHDEGFKSREEKITEKFKLFSQSGIVIYCKDQEDIDSYLKKSNLSTLSWGWHSSSDIIITKQLVRSGNTVLKLAIHGTENEFLLPFTDKVFIENAIHCICTMIYLKIDPDIISKGLLTLQPIHMRMSIRKGKWGNLLLDDTYNSDLVGLGSAVQVLHQQSAGRSKTLILSDILQTGLTDADLYKQVSDLINREQIELVLAVGERISGKLDCPHCKTIYYSTVEELLASEYLDEIRSSCILVKGARPFRFERIVNYLEEKAHQTVLEINLTNLLHNLSYYRSLLNPGVKIMAMVKALSYGSGSEIPTLLQHIGVDYLGVAYPDEGIELRNRGIDLPIMVMNSHEEDIPHLVKYKLEPEIYSISFLKRLIENTNNTEVNIHLKIETGMNRLGFSETDIPELINLIQSNPGIHIASIFSHLAAADEEKHDEFTHSQATTFYKLATEIKRKTGHKAMFHLVNSTGISRFPMYHFHMVRLGLGLHGISSVKKDQFHLKPVESFKTCISQVREVPPTQTIGYSRMGKLNETRKIATLAVGYADGFRRALGNGNGKVLIQGKEVPIIGNVCMDMCMADVTGLDVKVGDEVTLFGQGLPIEKFSRRLETIPYEVLTGISERVKRVYVYG
ncbi:MAG: bifunctional UDP-N-acetylmuramoyl-tripeptide:D-alanyl-D-alanine ligase/alanine racemase [Cyclobacteriaceae bacterium]|nr:bifunctional UDP-N-acetylmuramoyl-tripeptide:D-alanyl-D-alanine ligase/alanine racemase [Cyclobacteriaceae bacterium]